MVPEQHISDQWYPSTHGNGSFHLQIAFKPSQRSLSIEDFDLLKVIGKGSFGKVMQVRKKDTQRIYALKVRSVPLSSRLSYFSRYQLSIIRSTINSNYC